MAKYTKKYSMGRSVGFIIPLLAMMFVGILYLMTAKNGHNGASFILVSVAAGLVIYWVHEVRKISSPPEQRAMMLQESNQRRDWIYDLIKDDQANEMVFVAEVPGPEDKINVWLAAGTLKIKGGQNFAKDVSLETTSTDAMGISEYKYRNGVLTVKIQRKS